MIPEPDGEFRLDSISPVSGHTGRVEYISLSGSFPSLVNVWFGEQNADLVYFSQNWIVVAAPVRAEPGTVDVSLRSRVYGTVALRRSAYTFVDAENQDPGPDPTTSTTDQPSSTVTVSPSTTSGSSTTMTTLPEDPPSSSSSTSSTVGSDSTLPASSTLPTSSTLATSTTMATSTTVPEPVVSRTPRNAAVGDPIEFGNGINGVRLDGLANLHTLTRCSSDPCLVSGL